VQQSLNLYLGVLFAREVVNVQKQALASYNEHLAQADKLYKAGVVARYDLIRAQTAVKDQERRLTEAQNRADLATAALKTSLSLDDSPVSITGALFEADEPQSLSAAQDAASKTNPILLALSEKVKAIGMSVEMEKADGRPQVIGVAKAELLRGALAQTDPKWVVGVEASMNIFDGGVRNARISEKEWERRQAETERQSAFDQIKLGVQSAYLEIDSAKTALTAARKSRELAEEGLRLAMRRFEVGAGTSLEVLDANVAREAAQVGEYQTLYQLDTAYFKLHRLMNDIEKVSEGAGK
jgi:outer membrane protein TolC